MRTRPIHINAEWDDETKVWRVSSDDVPGLALEAADFDDLSKLVEAGLAGRADFDAKAGTLARRPIVIHASWPR